MVDMIKLREYFKYADEQGLTINGVKILSSEDINNINNKRTEIFKNDWKYSEVFYD